MAAKLYELGDDAGQGAAFKMINQFSPACTSPPPRKPSRSPPSRASTSERSMR
jgi:hypothetical protein